MRGGRLVFEQKTGAHSAHHSGPLPCGHEVIVRLVLRHVRKTSPLQYLDGGVHAMDGVGISTCFVVRPAHPSV